MDYAGALKYIENIDFLGSKLGLGRIEELLKRLGNPQDKLRIIHVAGKFDDYGNAYIGRL